MQVFGAKPAVRLLCAASSISLLTSGAAKSAEFVVLPQSSTLVMLGELRNEDVQIFSDYLSRGITEVVLSSPGGSLQAAWEIGELVEEAELTVVLPDEADCASACTIVFMHGRERVMGETARLGFHLPFLESDLGFEELCSVVEFALEPLVEEQRNTTAQVNPRDFEYNASHILVETLPEAQEIRAELQNGADFAELARRHSIGPSAPNGGQLGWFSVGMMLPSFEEVTFALGVGEVSAPVQTQFGWHVVLLHEVRRIDENWRRGQSQVVSQTNVLTPSQCYSMAFQMGALEFTRISRLLGEVGVTAAATQGILELILTTPSSEIAWVSRADAIEFGLASR